MRYVIYFVIGIGFAWWSRNKRPELQAWALLLRVIAWPIFLLRARSEGKKQWLQRLDEAGVPGIRMLFPGLLAQKKHRNYKRFDDHETYRQADRSSPSIPEQVEGDGHAGLDIKIPKYGPITGDEPPPPPLPARSDSTGT